MSHRRRLHGDQAYPVLNDAQQIHIVLYTVLDRSWLANLAAHASLTGEPSFGIVNRNGAILTRCPKPKQWVIEIVPSMLMADGVEKIGANLRALMEATRTMDEVVVFIEEFDEIAGNRDTADRIDTSITNGLLTQIPLPKNQEDKILLICATHYIRQLDPAILRPGRFDCIIPVGGLDREGRATIVEHYLSKLNTGEIYLEEIVERTSGFTPADIQYLFQEVAQLAFEQEHADGKDYRVTLDAFLRVRPKVKPSLSDQVMEEVDRDVKIYLRV